MKSAQKRRSSVEKQKDEAKASTGKKLIQARLPFKILSTAAGTDSTDTKSVTKKRKIQFEDDTDNLDTKVGRKSISKSDVNEKTTITEISSSSLNVISIQSSDDEESTNAQSNEREYSTNSEEKITVRSESHRAIDSSNRGCSDSPQPQSSADKKKSNKLKIKFPFKGKKKRNRKNDSTTSKESDGNEDKEIIQNPLKKAKKDETLDNVRKENNLTPSSVIELISDDDEPIDDSDASTVENVKCLNEKSNYKDGNVHDKQKKVEEEAVLEQLEENGTTQAKSIFSKAVGDDENEKEALNDQNNEVGNVISVNDIITVEDDDTNLSSKQSISTETSRSTNEDTLCGNFEIKRSSVRINKREFNKLIEELKESEASEARKQVEISDQENENNELCNSCVSAVSFENEDLARESPNFGEDDKEIEKSTLSKNLKSGKDAENDPAMSSSISKAKQSSKLTPTRPKKLKEMEQRRDGRLRMKEEREKKLAEERDQKKKEKEEKELQKKKEKEEREEQKRREKEEKEKKRLAEIEAKNEERRQKEEEKRRKEEIKEEEKRKKEEERKKKEQEKEETENKKRRAAEAFTKFFVLQKPSSSQQQQQQKDNDDNQSSKDSSDELQKCSKFMPFQVKDRMKLAPLSRRVLNNEERTYLDKILTNVKEQDSGAMQNLYLNILKSGKYTPRQDTKTYPKDDDSSDVLILEDELEGAGQVIDETIKPQKFKAKFLYFHENQRPPYYGTWRKKSKTIKPKRPFATDTVHFDYEVDSDEEWEEEEPGESLSGSDDDKDKESEDEYEVDNEFFVPHGHLSEEEMRDGDEEEDNSPEIQKAKLKLLQLEFAHEMGKKTEKIKPKLVGIVWQDENGNKPDECPDVIWSSLNKRAMMFTAPPIVVEPEKPQKQQDTEVGSGASPNEQKQQKQKEKVKLTEDLIKDLIRLFHGNTHRKEFLIKEFQTYIAKKQELNLDSSKPIVEYSKVTIRKKIDKMAEWTIYQKSEKDKKKLCWIISSEYLKRYNLEDLSLVNQWTYILQPKKRFTDKINDESTPKQTITNSEIVKIEKDKDAKKNENKSCFPVITKFTKIVSKDEKLNQIKHESNDVIQSQSDEKVEEDKKPEEKSKAQQLTVKKRVPLLLSVPRGEYISQERKNKLISDFLKKKQHENGENEIKQDVLSENKVVPMEIDNNDVIIN